MIVTLGDIHGEFDVLQDLANDLPKNSTIIQVGDFGAGFVPFGDLIEMDKFLHDRKINLKVVRGNHDNPKMFGNYGNDFPSKELYRTDLLADWSCLHLEGKRVLCAGGAISIDRDFRSLGKDYWIEEAFFLISSLESIRDIDVVITHSAPKFCFPSEKFISLHTESITEDVEKEREDLQKMYKVLKENQNPLDLWVYGHFHQSNSEFIDDTHFKLLDINEVFEIR